VTYPSSAHADSPLLIAFSEYTFAAARSQSGFVAKTKKAPHLGIILGRELKITCQTESVAVVTVI
jgi:hypothetical protein